MGIHVAFQGAGEHLADARRPMPVTGPLVHDQGLAEMVARLVVRSPGQGYHPEVEESVGFPARVAERLREGQRLLEVARGPLVLAEFAAQNADHEIGVRHVTAAIDRAEYVPATTQQGEGLGRLSLLAAYLGEEERGLRLAVGVGEPSAELEDPFEAGGRLGQQPLPPVGAREPGQAVGLTRDVLQLAEDGMAAREMRNGLRQAVLTAAQVAQAAQQRCLGMPVAGQPGGAKSNLVGVLPLVPADVHLEEVREHARERLPEPPQALAPYLLQAYRQAGVLGRQPPV